VGGREIDRWEDHSYVPRKCVDGGDLGKNRGRNGGHGDDRQREGRHGDERRQGDASEGGGTLNN